MTEEKKVTRKSEDKWKLYIMCGAGGDIAVVPEAGEHSEKTELIKQMGTLPLEKGGYEMHKCTPEFTVTTETITKTKINL